MSLKKYSEELIQLILEDKIPSQRKLDIAKAKLAKKHSLNEIPTSPTVLSYAKKKSKKLLKFLGKKRMRSLSGLVPVAVMCSPHKCPGNCLYCPSSLIDSKVPQSYTGTEPATMRAIQHEFDPHKQVKNRLEQLSIIGHSIEKIQLIVMGGTFLSTSLKYQKDFVTGMLNAVTEKNAHSLESAKHFAEKSKNRVIGTTFETRPDYCKKPQVNRMLSFGGTSCELGVQILNDSVYKKVSRGHSVKDVSAATRLLKDAGLKVTYHCMPGMPFASEADDLNSFKEMFFSQNFKPDMLKLYPCLVTEGTELYKMWKERKYSPLTTHQAANRILKMKEFLPTYVRIMRIQRDIPSTLVSAGVKNSNLRQIVAEKEKKKGIKCHCIRCREVGLTAYKQGLKTLPKPELFIQEYSASNGTELFLSFEDKKQELLFALCRLRIPENSFRKEISNKAGVIRELRVFGESLPLGLREKQALQHKGLGKKLVSEAEKIALEQFDRKKMAILSGLGVKEYYKKHLNYCKEGPYMVKSLDS